ncbi:porin [Caballeronia sordidicola]|uniref:porin n=1 Tax=Caballeronia sordidicola TaxID=196367 RepID=UPI00068B78E2|nr:porin [Caballeronia sordidicola]
MLKEILLGAMACTTLCTSAAYAQSSVTLYSIIDLGVRYVDNQGLGSVTSLSSGGVRTSRLGLRGREDLGGSMSAGLKLETVMFPNTGAARSATVPGQFWSRDAYLELGHKDYGTLRMGYDLNPTYVAWFENDPWLNIGMGSSGVLYDTSQNGPLRTAFGTVGKNETTAIYTRNMVKYFTPATGGFSGAVSISVREGNTTTSGAAQQTLVRLVYKRSVFRWPFHRQEPMRCRRAA